MRFETMGDPARPAAVMIHGMFSSNSSCARFARFLQDEYYVILPTLDSHHPGSAPLRSAGQLAENLLDWLGREGIGSLALLHGTPAPLGGLGGARPPPPAPRTAPGRVPRGGRGGARRRTHHPVRV